MSSQVTEADIRALVQGIRESTESVNNLVDLLEYLQGPDWSKRPRPASKVVAEFQSWMRTNYACCKDQLLELLAHESHDVQQASLDALLLLIKAEGTSHKLTLHTYTFPNSLLHQVTDRLLDSETNTSLLIGHFKHYLIYDDIRFHWMKNIGSLLSLKKVSYTVKPLIMGTLRSRQPLHNGQTASPQPILAYIKHILRDRDNLSTTDKRPIPTVSVVQRFTKQQITQQLVENAFCALQPLHAFVPSEDSQLNHFFAARPPELESEEGTEGEGGSGAEGVEDTSKEEVLQPPRAKKSRSELRALDVQTLQKHRKQFSDAWLSFLRLPLSSTIHKKVLVLLHSEVMPHLMEPRLLLDFLVDSYDTGGVVSLLALNGLFILMHHYHLDYPNFYTKLYGLLEPSVFHVKYMPRFFSLMDTFLTSTHLPLYMVAAFTKKVARLTLTAPPQGVMVGVVFVVNLLKRHPNCKVLLHRKNEEGQSLGSDPFVMNERDLSQCRALESCLWEIKTLQSHYCPEVSLLVSKLLRTATEKQEDSIGKYLDKNDEEMLLSAETKLSKGEDVPLNFQKPNAKWAIE